MAVEGTLAQLGAGIPETDGLISRGGGEQIRVGGELDVVDTVYMASKGALALGEVEIEELDAVVE